MYGQYTGSMVNGESQGKQSVTLRQIFNDYGGSFVVRPGRITNYEYVR